MKDLFSCKIDPFTRGSYKLDESDTWKDLSRQIEIQILIL